MKGRIMAKVSRKTYELNSEEIDVFERLPPIPEVARRFWDRMAVARGLDQRSVIGLAGYRFTALSVGHGKHWCYPSPLECKAQPVSKEA